MPRKKVLPPLTEQVVDISTLETDPNNPREHPEENQRQISKSLEEFGPLRSLSGTRLPDGRIVVKAGNGTVVEASKLGIKRARIIPRKRDEVTIVVADDLTDDEWAKYAVVDNRTTETSYHNDELLLAIHERVDLSDFYGENEIAAWIAEDQPDYEELWDGMPEFDQQDASAPYSVKVNFYSEEDIQEFAKLVGQTVTPKSTYINFPHRPDDDLTQYSVDVDIDAA